jgi:hypothetical protein
MIDQETFDRIVFKVTESVLLRMPEVIGNLIREHAVANKLNKEFYEKYPEFKSNMDLVASIIEQVESENVALGHEGILDKSVPIIRERMKITKELDIKKPKIESLGLDTSGIDESNGVL